MGENITGLQFKNCDVLFVDAGNPFMFMVIDPLKVCVRGDGLGLIKANQSTSFVITAPAADVPDLDVVITGMVLQVYCYRRYDVLRRIVVTGKLSS